MQTPLRTCVILVAMSSNARRTCVIFVAMSSNALRTCVIFVAMSSNALRTCVIFVAMSSNALRSCVIFVAMSSNTLRTCVIFVAMSSTAPRTCAVYPKLEVDRKRAPLGVKSSHFWEPCHYGGRPWKVNWKWCFRPRCLGTCVGMLGTRIGGHVFSYCKAPWALLW